MSDEQGVKPRTEGSPLDLSRVVERTRNMMDPELKIAWNGYMADMTALAVRLMVQTAADAGKGSSHPQYLDLTEYEPGSMDLVARPTLEQGSSTVRVNWVGKKTKKPRVDLQRYLLLERFSIPHGMRAHVPVERPAEGDPRLIFYFSRARYAGIGKRGKSASVPKEGAPDADS